MPETGATALAFVSPRILIKPVAQIEFTEWTPDGHLRHSKFVGLKEDKDRRAVVRKEYGVTHSRNQNVFTKGPPAFRVNSILRRLLTLRGCGRYKGGQLSPLSQARVNK